MLIGQRGNSPFARLYTDKFWGVLIGLGLNCDRAVTIDSKWQYIIAMNVFSKFFGLVGDIMASKVGILIFVFATLVNMAIIFINVVAFGSLGALITTVILSVAAATLGTTPVVWAIIMLIRKRLPLHKDTDESIATGVAYNTLNASMGVWLGAITIWASVIVQCICDYCTCVTYGDCKCVATLTEVVDVRVAMAGILVILSVVAIIYGTLAMVRLIKQKDAKDTDAKT